MRIPPKTFNPLTASPDQLTFYGLPDKPTDQVSLAQWTYMMAHLRLVDPPPFLAEAGFRADATSSNWSGFVANQSCSSSCYWAEAYYNEWQTLSTTCSPNALFVWAGLGGWNNGSVLAQDGTAHNAPGISDHGAFYEILPSGAVAMSIAGHAGYGFIALTKHVSGGFYFYVYDYYSGQASSVTVSSSSYDSTTADFIVERPSIGGVDQWLTNYSYVTFKDAWVNGNSSGNGVGNYPHFAVQMWNGGDRLADTSGTSNNGQTFTDYWHNCS